MKLNLKQTLKTLEGEDMVNSQGEPVTFGFVVSSLLLGAKVGDKKLYYQLGKKAFKEEEVELNDIEKSVVKNLLEGDQTFGALVIGQILELF